MHNSNRRSANAGHSALSHAYNRTPGIYSSKTGSLVRAPAPQMFERYRELTKRSYLADEFAIKNPMLNQSCFLNVALQALWVFPAVRMNMVTFCDLREGGPPELKPLINAIQDFYRETQ